MVVLVFNKCIAAKHFFPHFCLWIRSFGVMDHPEFGKSKILICTDLSIVISNNVYFNCKMFI